jgi:hypothetical protein
MAHYAVLDENNVVIDVFVGKDEHELLNGEPVDWEQYYGAKRTSYNTFAGQHRTGGTPFRKNYAGLGYTYDPARDAFIPPKPSTDSIFDESSCQWIMANKYVTIKSVVADSIGGDSLGA